MLGLKQLDNLDQTYGYYTAFNNRYGPSPDELWNWQTNQRKGVEFFNGEKLRRAREAWDVAIDQLDDWENFNRAHAQDNYPMFISQSLNAAEVNTTIEGNMVIGSITISSHHRNLPAVNVSLLIADALKRYNGGSYYSIRVPNPGSGSNVNPGTPPQLPVWRIDKTQLRGGQQADYVQEIANSTGW